MKKFFKVIGIGTAICTAVGVAVVVTKKIIDKVNNDDVVEDEDPEFVDEETAENSEKSDTTKTE